MATTNIDFKNITSASYNGTNLKEIWWCCISNATCCRIWPQYSGYICVRNSTMDCCYVQTCIGDAAPQRLDLYCLPRCVNMEFTQGINRNCIDLCSSNSCIVPNGYIRVGICNCTNAAITYPISYTGRLYVKPLGDNPKTVFLETSGDASEDDYCSTLTQTVNYTCVCANTTVTVNAHSLCNVCMPSTWRWCYENQFTWDGRDLNLEYSYGPFQYMTGCGALTPAIVTVGSHTLCVQSYASVCCIDLI